MTLIKINAISRQDADDANAAYGQRVLRLADGLLLK